MKSAAVDSTRRTTKQPGVNVVGDGPQPFVADSLAVDAGHMRDFVAHDVIDRGLVARFIGYGSKCVAKGVEVPVAVDAE